MIEPMPHREDPLDQDLAALFRQAEPTRDAHAFVEAVDHRIGWRARLRAAGLSLAAIAGAAVAASSMGTVPALADAAVTLLGHDVGMSWVVLALSGLSALAAAPAARAL